MDTIETIAIIGIITALSPFAVMAYEASADKLYNAAVKAGWLVSEICDDATVEIVSFQLGVLTLAFLASALIIVW